MAQEASLSNQAFVFIKPHAVTDKVKALVTASLAAAGVKVVSEGSIASETIDQDKLIDQHYYAIASKATILKPEQLLVPEDRFQDKFGVSWQEALSSKRAFNATDACAKLGVDAVGLDAIWQKAKGEGKLIKFGGGFYCGELPAGDGQPTIFVFNAFFMVMRGKFTAPGQSIYYYVVEFDQAKLPWADFRGKLLGPTDPAKAPPESIRGQVLAQWEALGLKSKPNTGDNGVHASASPFEGLAERMNWLKAKPEEDAFGQKLLAAGIAADTIKAWSVDPVVKYDAAGAKGSLFDALEDMDCDPCVAKAKELAALA